MTKPRRALLLLGAVLALAAAALLLPVREIALRLLHAVESLGPWGALAYGAAYVLACVLMVPGTILTLGAGFLYGTLGGLLVVVPASLAGATAAFLLARTLARDWARERVAGRPSFAAIDRAVGRSGFRTVLLLRLSPVLPFNLLNYALGLTSVRLRDYVAASALGMFPATLLVVHAGALATSLAGLDGASPRGPARVALLVAGLAAMLVAVVLVGRAAKRALAEGGESAA